MPSLPRFHWSLGFRTTGEHVGSIIEPSAMQQCVASAVQLPVLEPAEDPADDPADEPADDPAEDPGSGGGFCGGVLDDDEHATRSASAAMRSMRGCYSIKMPADHRMRRCRTSSRS
jgi:hypothetical protein